MRQLNWISGAALAISLILPAWSYAGAAPMGLELEKTVGTDPANCAAATQIVVKKGTLVYYCYKVTNHESFTLATHTLDDSILGMIKLQNNGVFNIPPGGSMEVITPTAGYAINANTVNVATWTSVGTPSTLVVGGVVAAPDVTTVTAAGTAQVVIGAQPAPALGDAALAFVAAAMLLFGALRLTRKLRDQA
jgi:hypothetical protein